jgi:hypothetical protein
MGWIERYGLVLGVVLCVLSGAVVGIGQTVGDRFFVETALVLSVPVLYLAGVLISSRFIAAALTGGLVFGLFLLLGTAATATALPLVRGAESSLVMMVLGVVMTLVFGVVPVVVGAISNVVRHRTLVGILLTVDQLVSAFVLDLWHGLAGHIGDAALLGVGLVLTMAVIFGDRIRTVFGTGVVVVVGSLLEISYLLLSQAVVVPS